MWCCSWPVDRTEIDAMDKGQTLNNIYQSPGRAEVSKSNKEVPAAMMQYELSFHSRYCLFAGEESLVRHSHVNPRTVA